MIPRKIRQKISRHVQGWMAEAEWGKSFEWEIDSNYEKNKHYEH